MELEQQAFECVALLAEAHVLLICDQDLFGVQANLTMYLLCHEISLTLMFLKVSVDRK